MLKSKLNLNQRQEFSAVKNAKNRGTATSYSAKNRGRNCKNRGKKCKNRGIIA